MKKFIGTMTMSLFLLIVFISPASAQWVKTKWSAGTGFFELYSNRNTVFARTWDSLNGGQAFFTDDSGETWTKISSTDSDIDILSIVLLNNNILAGTWNGFFRSPSGSISWSAVAPTGIPAGSIIWSEAIINTTLFAGAKGSVYKSLDSGTTWTEIKTGIPANARITSLAGSGNSIFAGSDSNGVFTTASDGTNWSAVSSGLTDKHISGLAAMGTNVFAATLKGVFISNNSGSSWKAISSGLKDANCFLVIDNKVFAGTDTSGVYQSTDSGATWNSFNQGMPAGTRIWSLAAGNDNIFAGTSAGIWRIPFPTTPVTASVKTRLTGAPLRLLGQNGSVATVEFMLPAPASADLVVYDLSGNKTAALVHKKCVAGLHRVSFSTRSIAPGSYIMRLTAGAAKHQQTFTIQR